MKKKRAVLTALPSPRNCGDLGEMFIRPLLFKTPRKIIFRHKKLAQVSDAKAKTKVTPKMLRRKITAQNKFSGRLSSFDKLRMRHSQSPHGELVEP